MCWRSFVNWLVILSMKDEVPLVSRVVVDSPSIDHETSICDSDSNEVLPTNLRLNHGLNIRYFGQTDLADSAGLPLQF